MPLSLIPSPPLRWTLPSTPRTPYPIPSSITRSFISAGSNKELEILTAQSSSPSAKHPIFFLHGGFGGAFVWVEWMTFFQQHGYTCYAISLRGHGESWVPGFWRMTWGTGLAEFAQDVQLAWDETIRREDGRLPILVGHSSGGGLAQYVLSERLIKPEALVLCGSIPGFGGLEVHWNWAKLDLWFMVREFLHLMHPRSPLSSPSLVRNAFFSPRLPQSKVRQWQRWMPEWESLKWPLGMMGSFVSFPRVLENIAGLGKRRDHVCIITGSQDKLVSTAVAERLAQTFRIATRTMAENKKLDVGENRDKIVEERTTDVSLSHSGLGVRLVILAGAPHHFQNDFSQVQGAKQLLAFIEGLDGRT